VDKAHIIAEIQRTTAANGGKPLGRSRFEAETGINVNDWYGKYWARWKDAVAEAGYVPNEMQGSYDTEWLIEQLIVVIRNFGRYPTVAEIRLHSRDNPGVPSSATYGRLGSRLDRIKKIVEYCSAREGFDDVMEICRPLISQPAHEPQTEDGKADNLIFGFVYLMKSGRHYKIGHSNSAGRREYELAIQLPERLETVHTISTDDPLGIEAYWHKRFESKRLNGEWFNLNPADVKAFKRRKFM
jgi:hypothetical protein